MLLCGPVRDARSFFAGLLLMVDGNREMAVHLGVPVAVAGQ